MEVELDTMLREIIPLGVAAALVIFESTEQHYLIG
jgi:hypothetical protein